MTRKNTTKHCETTCSSLADDFYCNPDDLPGVGDGDLDDDETSSHSCVCNYPFVFDELTNSCVMANQCMCYDEECDDFVNGTDQETCCPGRNW